MAEAEPQTVQIPADERTGKLIRADLHVQAEGKEGGVTDHAERAETERLKDVIPLVKRNKVWYNVERHCTVPKRRHKG